MMHHSTTDAVPPVSSCGGSHTTRARRPDGRAHRGPSPAAGLGLCLLAATVSGTTVIALVGYLTGLLSRLQSGEPVTIEALTAAAIVAAGTVAAAWYALSAIAAMGCATARLAGRTFCLLERHLSRHGAPGIARLLGAGAGAVMAASLTLTPTYAAAPPDPQTPVAEDLTWGAAPAASAPETANADPVTAAASAAPTSRPDRDASTAGPEPQAAAQQAEPAAKQAELAEQTGRPESGLGHTVRPGESLWTIAAAHLPEGASPAEIARTWPQWYRANRAVIGTDPDLILPGTVLHAPAAMSSQTTPTTSKGATR